MPISLVRCATEWAITALNFGTEVSRALLLRNVRVSETRRSASRQGSGRSQNPDIAALLAERQRRPEGAAGFGGFSALLNRLVDVRPEFLLDLAVQTIAAENVRNL
ncbi:MAG TPA: hypothetical protein VMH28_08985 [Candidatus Acidoferrales bacterium]|nr:hypothetical protein [Candidatus Acidoferrales bacterium]